VEPQELAIVIASLIGRPSQSPGSRNLTE
jgi:hypothetical protein